MSFNKSYVQTREFGFFFKSHQKLYNVKSVESLSPVTCKRLWKQILVIHVLFCVESTSIFRCGAHKDIYHLCWEEGDRLA